MRIPAHMHLCVPVWVWVPVCVCVGVLRCASFIIRNLFKFWKTGPRDKFSPVPATSGSIAGTQRCHC